MSSLVSTRQSTLPAPGTTFLPTSSQAKARLIDHRSLTQESKPVFIGPESDHWLCLSLTDSLPHSCLVNLIDVTLACEDANSKLVEVVTVADVDAEDHVGNSLLIWELTFGHKAKLLFRL